MKLFLAIIFLVSFFCFPSIDAKLKQCSSKPFISMDRIFGGQDATPLEFPHQVSLQIRYLNSHVCGGTLIADNWILTAAHCFSRSRYPFHWKAQLGDHNIRVKEASEREFLITKVIVHQNYNSQNQLNDLALAKLEKPVDFKGNDRHIKPVCLADKDFVVRTGYQCVVTGWGKSSKGYVTTDILQKLSQPLLDSKQCARVWQGIGWPITDKHVCVGDLKSSKGVCSGDSGGPVQCKLANGEWVQVGITSWTTSTCTTPGYAAVFTKVSAYRDWIEEQISKN